MAEIYFSTDIESDGPIPGEYSMLSFASAAYDIDKNLISTFEANLKTLPGAKQHPDTMDWWMKPSQLKAWDTHRQNTVDPEEAITEYLEWVAEVTGRRNTPVFVAYPAGFDFTFMYWYMMKFAGECPFSFAALDVKTLAMAMTKKGYREVSKKKLPKRWFDDLPHTHRALDDAIEQGALFINMMRENLGLPPIKST